MPIEASKVVCWQATCDGCGDGDNTEYDGAFHYDSETEARAAVLDANWLEMDGRLLCEECADAARQSDRKDQ